MYTKAKRPENLFVRVLQQNDPEVDVHCLDAYCERITTEKGLPIEQCPFSSQIDIHHIHAKEAAGPTWARGLLSRDIEAAYLRNELKAQVRKAKNVNTVNSFNFNFLLMSLPPRFLISLVQSLSM